MAWRSRLYWSNIACDGASVAAGGDGEGVEWSWSGLGTPLHPEGDGSHCTGVVLSRPPREGRGKNFPVH